MSWRPTNRGAFRDGNRSLSSGSTSEMRGHTVLAPFAIWLPDMDLNHDKQIQSLLCYRYTIGQAAGDNLGIFSVASST